MSEQLAGDHAVIYKILCNVASGLVVDFTHPTEARFNQEDAFEDAFDHIQDLYEEGVGEDLTEEQVYMLANIAVCNKAWFIFESETADDGRNFHD